MGVVDRINAEMRTIGGVPWQPWRNPYWKFSMGGPVHPSREVSGVDQVLGLAAVYSCVRIIADMVASLPINVYRNTPDGPQIIPQTQLLTNPSADLDTTLYDWVFQCMSACLLWGNAWGLISSRTGVTSQSGLGYPQTIEWLPPDRMAVQDDEQQPENPFRAKIYYNGRLMNRSELVHVRAFVIPGRLEAVSPMRMFAMLHQQGLSALDYSATWFRNGGFPPGTFQNLSEEVNAEQAREIRQRLTDTLRTRQPLVYGKDWDYKPVVVPPNEAAFVEAMQLNATQVAAIYGVPPSKVGGKRGDSLTYATQEQETLSLITDTLRPWLVRMEHMITSLLPATQYARFNTDALLKTDLKTRSDIYRIQREIGMITIDEMRQKEDMQPLPGTLGSETIPLEALVRMSSTTRAIPKSMLPQLSLEPELISGLLEELQIKGLAPPNPDTYAGQQGPETLPGQQDYISKQLAADKSKKPPTAAPPPTAGVGESPGSSSGGSGAFGSNGVDPNLPIKVTPAQYLGHQITLSRGDEVPGFFGLRHQRATDADRTRAIGWLRKASAAGSFATDDDEYDIRVEKAAGARIKGQLDELVNDLPSEQELSHYTGPPEKRPGGPEPHFTFGPAAATLLQERAIRMDGEPSLNGRGSR